jgi:hypothetical protein
MASSVFRCHVLVRRCGTGGKDVLLLRSTGANEGSSWSVVVVCSRRQAQTEQQNGENCTFIENEIFVRTIVFFGAFAKLRKATVSIVMRACPSVRMEQCSSYWTYLLEICGILAFQYFSKICRENYSSLLSDKCYW